MSGAADTLRVAAWLDAGRARAYARILIVVMAAGLGFSWLSDGLGHHPFAPPPPGAPPGLPQPADFVTFWAAGHLAAAGQAASAYDIDAMDRVEHAVSAMPAGIVQLFFYPPPWLLVLMPLSLLPYTAALLGFALAQTLAFWAVLRRLAPGGWGFLPVLAYPGTLMNAATGQNGCVTALLFALPALLLDTRPVLAGLCLGALAYKPQFALAVPVVLLAARRWRAAAAAAVASGALLAGSAVLLGPAAWRGFAAITPLAASILTRPGHGHDSMQSLFNTLYLAGAPPGLCAAAQALLACGTLGLAAALAWRRPAAPACAALMAAAALLCTPYAVDYDLPVAGVALAFLAAEAARRGFLPWERAGAAAIFLWPLLARPCGQLGLALGPVVLLILFALVARRCRAAQAGRMEIPA